MSKKQKPVEKSDGSELGPPDWLYLAKLAFNLLVATKQSFFALQAFILLLFDLWTYQGSIFDNLNSDTINLLNAAYFLLGLYAVAIYAVHINFRLKVTEETNPASQRRWINSFALNFSNYKFLFFW